MTAHIDRLRNVRSLAQSVADDCEEDAAALDSVPFSPAGIGKVLGEMLAMVKALASMVETLADVLEEREG